MARSFKREPRWPPNPYAPPLNDKWLTQDIEHLRAIERARATARKDQWVLVALLAAALAAAFVTGLFTCPLPNL